MRTDPRHVLVLLALVATAHALLYLPFEHHVLGDSPTYIAAANALRHGSYSTPLRAAAAPATGVSDHPGATVDLTDHRLPAGVLGAKERQVLRAPIYPALVALVGGAAYAGLSRDLLYVVQALLIGLSTLLVGGLGMRLWGPRVGIVGAAVFALDPFSKRYAGLVLTEALAMALASLAAYAFVRAWRSSGLRWWSVTGLAGGLLVLTRPGLAAFVLVLVVAGALRAGTARARALRVCTLLATCAVMLVPWLSWTAGVTGTASLQAYGPGVNLLVGARGQSPGRSIFMVATSRPFVEDVRQATAVFPSPRQLLRDPSAHARYLVRVDAALRDRALSVYRHELTSDPARLLNDFGGRAAYLWMAHTDWYQPRGGVLLLALRLADWIVLLAIVAGVAIAARRSAAARALGAGLVVTTLILATSEAQARFTIPLRPIAFAFAAVALTEAFDLVTRLRAAARGRAEAAASGRVALAVAVEGQGPDELQRLQGEQER